jgi:hypothetical protein
MGGPLMHPTPAHKAKATRTLRSVARRTNFYAYVVVLSLLSLMCAYHGSILFKPAAAGLPWPNEEIIAQLHTAQSSCGPVYRFTAKHSAAPWILFSQPILASGFLCSILFLVSHLLLRSTRAPLRVLVPNILFFALVALVLCGYRIEDEYIQLRHTQLTALSEPAQLRLTKTSLLIPVTALSQTTSTKLALRYPESIVPSMIRANKFYLELARDAIREVTWGFDTIGRRRSPRFFRFYYRIISTEHPDKDIKLLRHVETESQLYQFMRLAVGQERLTGGRGGRLHPTDDNRVGFNCAASAP